MIKIITNDIEEKITNFLVYDVDTNIINGLRRIMMSELKSHAFNEKNIIINKNTSLLHNEIIRHRLSLIPINTQDTLKVELNIKNLESEILNVYSHDLKIIGKGEIYPDILLYKLKKNQKIELIATSDKNNTSIIYKSIITSFFKIIKQLSISKNVDNNLIKEIKNYLKKEYNLINEKNIHNNHDKNILGLFYEIKNKSNFIKNLNEKFNLNENDLLFEELHYNNNPVYSFTIESIYLEPIEILKKTILLFQEKFNMFLESNIEIEETNYMIKLYIQNETPTLLNTLSFFLRKNKEVKYSNYNKKHPLDDFIVLNISLDNNLKYIEILKETINNINTYLDNLLKYLDNI
jgi:DNA-directed RNA polymerase subunit L/DNA-directed RNA polymerase alpha subunit